MTENIARQPKGIPVGGQFAATTHSEPGTALSASDEQASFAEMGAAARAGLTHSSATHIAALLKKSPEAVYDENVATLAAANGCTYEDIHGINLVFNQGDRPLRVTGTGNSLPNELAAAGLTGDLSPYTGNNPDIEEGAWAYKSPTDRELVLSRTEDGGFSVWHEDRYDENSFHLETAPEDVTPESNLDSIKSALWDLAVTDANNSSPTPLSSGDFYELRDVRLEKNSRGEAYAEILASNDDGMWTTVSHNFATGATTVDRDGDLLTGPAADIEMAAVFEGLHSEPDNGDFEAHAKTVFGNLLTQAAADPDAPRWAADLAAKEAGR
ncbi:hypothetical protein Achl_4206 (plasmid) [Pseudarthrobacter chlorophenolicus A6]|uniref:Uncharacterized protein n=1 Tax=Pseudarthrobacter chlorophenolicus (strain ATCC 700700 / DSM 12829 / CIP 107037 / JCM 12360 / KCTC 9906 / NCIMB 13794 / A6) TaxID=452863 RepID=B8HIB0_PSECP|nr:hypothetical protein [Pseudarthrobacter chlorophenolicus]ACL42157.1 hypothetical protein Achl_4206 [Pseudarthrobacter chlorophenolicus A6]SDQ14185.1 hypothetical protein SAMN04489738_0264 [Pseudarthrobacter chlorophenolicus]